MIILHSTKHLLDNYNYEEAVTTNSFSLSSSQNYEALLSLDCFRISEPNCIKNGKFRFCAGHLIHFNPHFCAFHS